MARINYDQISKRYDERYRVNRFEGVTTTLLDFVAATRAHDVLEVGCGTGRWITDLPAEAAEVCGLDLSLGMLRKAREKSTNLRLVCANANHLPFCNETINAYRESHPTSLKHVLPSIAITKSRLEHLKR